MPQSLRFVAGAMDEATFAVPAIRATARAEALRRPLGALGGEPRALLRTEACGASRLLTEDSFRFVHLACSISTYRYLLEAMEA